MRIVYNPTELDLTFRIASRISEANPFGEVRLPKRTVSVLPDDVADHACREFLEHGVRVMHGDEGDVAIEREANQQALRHATESLRFARGATKFDREADPKLPGTLTAKKVVEEGLSKDVTVYEHPKF